ncbi:hypothetical protein DSO57_1029044 [Entomophthora muscae]|uniref:Uncharacterized protein n=1 Tax=Entomophthora muscae TaxID=34485 RepID=A0ACC2SE80_9FUNG|nr:hypothetical protein DSO57_1029044 [Entomophthora muscae]
MSKDKTHHSLFAGLIAGGVEAAVTYPTEYVKTQLQLPGASKRFKGPVDCLTVTVREKGVSGLYRGVGAMVIGTSAKAGVRFCVYDHFKDLLADLEGRLSPIRSLAAGLAAGVSEAILVVTPSETIKTKLIQDRNAAQKQYSGLVHGVKTIFKQEGITGIYQEMFPVVLRQGANQAIRLTTYQQLKDIVTPFYQTADIDIRAKTTLPFFVTFGLGMVAGTITVYTTMPIDVIKTKMQITGASSRYKSSLDCLIQTVRNEGTLSLWNGATPRLSRLLFSGGIVFTVYEQMMSVFRSIN